MAISDGVGQPGAETRTLEELPVDGEIDWQLTEALANAQAQQLSGRPL